MNKLDFEIMKRFGTIGNKDIVINFINALDIDEAKPLQKWIQEAEKEDALFPSGLTKDEMLHMLSYVYSFERFRMENAVYHIIGEFERNVEKMHDILWNLYSTDIDKFRDIIDMVTSKSYKFILIPIETDPNPPCDLDEALRMLKTIENIPGWEDLTIDNGGVNDALHNE